MEVCYGNKYHLGEHVLFCGDATNPEHLSILMGADKADLVFTDPPYDLPKGEEIDLAMLGGVDAA